jgi:hypothetical protein
VSPDNCPVSTGALRQRRHRQRVERGAACVSVEINSEIINWLARIGWLADREAHDPAEIGRAISALLAASARDA